MSTVPATRIGQIVPSSDATMETEIPAVTQRQSNPSTRHRAGVTGARLSQTVSVSKILRCSGTSRMPRRAIFGQRNAPFWRK